MDERTRLALEGVLGTTPADRLPGALDAEVARLAPAAESEARELAQRYVAYQAAQRAEFPPGNVPNGPQAGLSELAALSRLRESYFGQDAARGMFGSEEAMARRLLQLMQEETAPGLDKEEIIMRAQTRLEEERAAGTAPVSTPEP